MILSKQINKYLDALFPLNRSITGNGVRQSLKILKNLIPIKIHEVPSGTKVFDWVVPKEWNVKDAFIKDSSGQRIIDFQKLNLHLVGYSIPFKGKMELKDLKQHLHTIPKQPKLVPYVTSYYKEDWGFCLSQENLDH